MSQAQKDKWVKELRDRIDENLAYRHGKMLAYHIINVIPTADGVICTDGTKILYDEEDAKLYAQGKAYQSQGAEQPAMPERLFTVQGVEGVIAQRKQERRNDMRM